MNTDHADPADLAAIRAAFEGTEGREPALGWDAVRAFEAEHGVVLPEPYRTFVAEIADGSASGPPHYGLLPLARLPDDWDGEEEVERDPSRPFPLTEAWLWEEEQAGPRVAAAFPVDNAGRAARMPRWTWRGAGTRRVDVLVPAPAVAATARG
ncbi:SMI1/KNR4 family protein [Streptomyces sp. CHD11]|uniref:SMI1/KNR4 family protein n=1 Tax=Streptomyces sp. CHD11 TaxID=2741325 RepID=UPI001BFC50DC|nr:SMI1/KNR4 family protein [Streptomyces sp. CHD11]MBT3154506.1 SMI1/KNR4 family protein [Streptomyces sp. CHD11]